MIEYLASPTPSLWHFADEGDAYVWSHDKSTITMSAELVGILGPLRISLGGLPSLTAVLFVVAALRSTAKQVESDSTDFWSIRLRELGGRSIQLKGVAQWLDGLRYFPDDVRGGIEGPISVLGCGLENGRRYLIEADLDASDEVLEVLALPREVRDEQFSQTSAATTALAGRSPRTKRAWETLMHLSRSGMSVDQLRTWKATGLMSLPEPPKEEVVASPKDPINRLLRELVDDGELGSLARLSRTTSALVTLPRRPSDPDRLPIGGVSDVTNRGNPEQLLMTELAADPMLLLARIATGQALYLRRETPPGPSPDRRPVAIEAGIRCWGETRVRLAALALAIGASEERRGDTKVDFTMVFGRQFAASDLHSREGLMDHLAVLDPSEHPGVGIQQWLIEAMGNQDATLAEPVILVSAATDADPGFRDAIKEVPRPFLIASIDREGRVVMMRRAWVGDDVLQKLTLDIPVGPTKRRQDPRQRLPIFLSQSPSPLAYSVDGKIKWCCTSRDECDRPMVWLVTANNRLLLARSRDHGVTEVIPDLPSHRVLAHQCSPHGLSLVVGSSNGRHHFIESDSSGSARRVALPEDGVASGYDIVGQTILRFQEGRHQEISTADGKAVRGKPPLVHPVGPGFIVRDNNQLYRHGGETHCDWHRVLGVSSSVIEPIQCVVPGLSGVPIIIHSDLSYLVRIGDEEETIYTKSIVYANGPPRPVISDFSGRYWIVEFANVQSASNVTNYHGISHRFFRIDTVRGYVTGVNGNDWRSLLWSTDVLGNRLVQQRSVRRKFQFVAITPQGLVMGRSSRSASILRLSDQPPKRLVLEPTPLDENRQSNSFHDVQRSVSNKSGWNLRCATLTGGSAWLDSRGLVHLQREDDPRELTLVLQDKHVAGWFSENGFFGPRFFSPFSHDGPSETITHSVPVPDAVIAWLEDWSRQA